MTDRATHSVRILGSPVAGVSAICSEGGWQFERHFHDTYGIGLLDQGAQSWASGRGRADAYAGDVMDTNPGEVHDGRPLGTPTRCWRIVSVPVGVMISYAGHTRAVEPMIARPVIADGLLHGVLERLFISIERWQALRDSVDALAVEEALAESCTLILARHGSSTAPVRDIDASVGAVRELLDAHPTRTPSLAELAQLAGLSRYQVLRRFRAHYGLSPHAWLLCRRVTRARALIATGMSIARVAVDTGFADQSHLTRVFGRVYGYTPGAWQRAVGGPGPAHSVLQ